MWTGNEMRAISRVRRINQRKIYGLVDPLNNGFGQSGLVREYEELSLLLLCTVYLMGVDGFVILPGDGEVKSCLLAHCTTVLTVYD